MTTLDLGDGVDGLGMTHSITHGGAVATGVAGASTIGCGEDPAGDLASADGDGIKLGVGIIPGIGDGIDHSGAVASIMDGHLTQITLTEDEELTIAHSEDVVLHLQEETLYLQIDEVVQIPLGDRLLYQEETLTLQTHQLDEDLPQ